MSPRTTYTYTVLRYVHDVASGEFLNVGVALLAPGQRYVNARCRTNYGRLRSVFPTLDGESFRAAMRHVTHSFGRFRDELRDELQLRAPAKDVMDFALAVLGKDDSSLQWSPVGSGVTADPERTLGQLFERFVTVNEKHDSLHRHQDDDVWRHFSRELQQRQVLEYFVPKTIAVKDDQIEFEHAWKNGVWHCLAPVSFDLASVETIKEKAHRWLGQVTSVAQSSEAFKMYFLVAPPTQVELMPAYESAVHILQKAPVEKEVFPESQARKLSDKLAAEVKAHGQSRAE